MKHTWIIEEVDGGHIGSDLFWKCEVCIACSNGHTKDPPQDPFIPCGCAIRLTEDCLESQEIILKHLPECRWVLDHFKRKHSFWMEWQQAQLKRVQDARK